MIQEVPIASKHVVFEKDFGKYCDERGYALIDTSYHHNFGDETAAKLRRDSSPASLSIRLAPDLMVQKLKDPTFNSFFVELKTGNTKKVIQCEAYQLLRNKVCEKYLRTPCLYIYRGGLSKNEMIACHANCIRVSKLILPKATKNTQVRPILENFFQVPTEEREPINGFSNDPYVEVTDFSNWKPIEMFMT